MSDPLRWVVALRPEADPLIERFELKKDSGLSQGGFPVFRNEDNSVFLVLSGIGKINAAAATAWLAARSPGQGAGLWINFGIAGTGTGNLGDVMWGARVNDVATGRSWYPQAVWKRKFDLPETEIRTFDKPVSEYPEGNVLVEMEASGFVPVALRFQSIELVQVVKVVSDTSEQGWKEVTATRARELCGNALQKVDPWLQEAWKIASADAERTLDPAGFSVLSGSFHLSATRIHQLRRLLQQWEARLPEESVEAFVDDAAPGSGKDLLDTLREQLWGRADVADSSSSQVD